MKPAAVWSSLRPEQWVKNGFVFAALIFSMRLAEPAAVARTVFAFVLLCLASSAAYLWNDVADSGRDRVHSEKRRRPVASGQLGAGEALAWSALLTAAALGGALWLDLRLLVCVAAFLGLQALYTLWLKHLPVVDVVAIASGFVLRTVAGVIAAGARMSIWLFLATFLLALFLALAKRRHELVSLGEGATSHRPALAAYEHAPVDALIVTLAVAVVGLYAGYTLDADVARRLGTERLFVTVPFVVFGVFRYLFLIYGRDRGGNPTETLLGDRTLLASVALWAVAVITLIYVE